MFGYIEDPDPIDLGITDDPDWPEPEWPDPSWHGYISGSPAHIADVSHADRLNGHRQDKSPNLQDGFLADRIPQPAPAPDNQPDWEAGQ
jgi:hypothetical protein